MCDDSVLVMYARAIDDAALRLDELRHEEWEDLGLGAVALALCIVATQIVSSLALPFFLGGLFLWFRGLRALVVRWNLVERLAEEEDAYVLPEVLERASRETTMDRRRSFAAIIRTALRDGELASSPFDPAVHDLELLASELEDERLLLEPAAAVACFRLLSEAEDSPFLNAALPIELLRSRAWQIRAGFFRPEIP